MQYDLTGETRWRNGDAGPVLQVAYNETRYYNCGPSVEWDDIKHWRDATAADYLNCPAIARKLTSEAA